MTRFRTSSANIPVLRSHRPIRRSRIGAEPWLTTFAARRRLRDELPLGDPRYHTALSNSSPGGNKGDLVSLFESGFQCVLVLQIVRVPLRWKVWPVGPIGTLLSALIDACLPLCVEALALVVAPGIAFHSGLAVAWLAALAFLDALGVLIACRCWDLWIQVAPSIEDLVSGCSDIEAIVLWYTRSLSRKRQYVTSSACAIVACAYLGLVQHAISHRIEVGFISYISVAWTAFVGANMIYWLLVNPEFIRRILRLKKLNMAWYSPASTTAIVKLSSGFVFTAIAVLAAFLTVEVLAFQINRYGSSGLLSSSTIFVPVIAGAITLAVGLMPHWWLYTVVRNTRKQSLESLRRLAGQRPPSSPKSVERVRSVIELHKMVEESPGLPFSTAMVPYAAAVLGSLVAYLLTR